MPSGWVHAVINFVAYGKTYFDFHKWKDAPHKIYGRRHRKVRHEWYQTFGKKWNLAEPFPNCLKNLILEMKDKISPNYAEETMAYIDHDYIDKVWVELADQEKKYREAFFMWLILNPIILKEWAGVDVLKSKLQRMIDGHKVWVYCPKLKSEYKRLCNYVKVVKEDETSYEEMLEQYG